MTTRPKDHAWLSWPLPELAVAGRVPLDAVADLATCLGIGRVVDLRAEDRDDPEVFRAHGLEVLHLPTPDVHAVSFEMLRTGVDWVREGLDGGTRVLVHCEHGIGRSVLLGCCVLVSLGHSPSAALERIKRVRQIASPSPDQLHGLLEWAAHWHRTQRTVCPNLSWDELARIAYCPKDATV